MIKTSTCVEVHCDECTEVAETYDGGIRHWPDGPAVARADIRDSDEWWTDGVVDLCDNCRRKPHAFIDQGDVHADECPRCSYLRDEHPDRMSTPTA